MTVLPLPAAAYESAIGLLAKANLPVQDIGPHTELFELRVEDRIIGTIGLEQKGTVGVLRSLSVAEGQRGNGYGEQLVRFLEETAKARGIETLYLLTTTAATFFSKRGYQIITRAEVPQAVQQTSEFASVCPASATVMKKELL